MKKTLITISSLGLIIFLVYYLIINDSKSNENYLQLLKEEGFIISIVDSSNDCILYQATKDYGAPINMAYRFILKRNGRYTQIDENEVDILMNK